MEATLNPDTLKTIRAQAEYLAPPVIARNLGWSLEKLQRIARDRGISLVNAHETPLSAPKPAAVTIAPVAVAAKPRGCTRQTNIDFGPDTTIEEIAEALRGTQRAVLVLLANHMDQGLLSGAQIVDTLPNVFSRPAISKSVAKLNEHLRSTRYRIRIGERGRGADRGYRLMTVRIA